jgi:hypothetical protein
MRARVCGAVRCGAVRCGAVRCGAVRCGAVRCGACVSLRFRPPQHIIDQLISSGNLDIVQSIDIRRLVTFGYPKLCCCCSALSPLPRLQPETWPAARALHPADLESAINQSFGRTACGRCVPAERMVGCGPCGGRAEPLGHSACAWLTPERRATIPRLTGNERRLIRRCIPQRARPSV